MDINGTTVLVTGANRGLGRALVDALLTRGAGRVYAAARDVNSLEAHDDDRVVALALDLTSQPQIRAAAERASDVRLLINNASTAAFTDPFSTDREALERELQTNYLGTLDAILAFAPVIERNGGGAVVNVLSLLSLASMPPMAGYSASKAAAHSMTQALRPGLRARGVDLHGVYPGGIDTDMLAGFDVPKTPPADVAEGILDGIVAGREDIFPDPTSEQMSVTWLSDPKAFERAFNAVP
jgi:NAD(P)-dependent dehydrogenase (short-subunit alcohol dehydrogenase family)